MIIVELYAGSKTLSSTFRAHGHQCLTVDIEQNYKPDIVADIGVLRISDLPKNFQRPDIVWASVPCNFFSVLSMGRNWESPGKPRTQGARVAVALLLRTLALIKELNPKFFFIENPCGMMRTLDFMQLYRRCTVHYCQYGLRIQKPTDIFTNCWCWVPRKRCSPGSACHNSSAKGLLSLCNSYERAKLPQELCDEIVKVCEKNLKKTPPANLTHFFDGEGSSEKSDVLLEVKP